MKMNRSQKPLKGNFKKLEWTVLNLNERVVIHSLSHYPCAWAQGVNPSPLIYEKNLQWGH